MIRQIAALCLALLSLSVYAPAQAEIQSYVGTNAEEYSPRRRQ
ncbi:hypothetical protein [uncultured Selenomonas sp.]|nr:hypothetical protein [uncultured Selenomonas sp.]